MKKSTFFLVIGFVAGLCLLTKSIQADEKIMPYILLLAQAPAVSSRDPGSTMIETQVDTKSFIAGSAAARAASKSAGRFEVSLEEDQIARINKSMKHLIDENQRILQEKEKIEESLQVLRGERAVQENRLTTLATERQRLLRESQEMEQLKKNYEARIKSLEDELTLRLETPEYLRASRIRDLLENVTDSQALSDKISSQDLEDLYALSLIQESGDPHDADSAQAILKQIAEEKLRQELAELISENQSLKRDTIKLHYNLANLFFEQGKYELAASEYRRVSQLIPQDAATHYNLAFVAENYLNDMETALTHYTKYVELAPDASDATLVKNKISRIKLQLRAKIDSLLERERSR